MEHNYQENNFLQLGNEISDIMKIFESINVKDIKDYYSQNISSNTKALVGDIDYFIPDPEKVTLPNMRTAINNMKSVRDIIWYINELKGENCNTDDIFLTCGDKTYFIFSQIGHAGTEGDLYNTRYIFTDGQGGKAGVSLKGASCSMCATLNAICNLMTPGIITHQFNDNILTGDKSLNSSILVRFNQLLSSNDADNSENPIDLNDVSSKRTLGVSKLDAIDRIVGYFEEDLDHQRITYGNLSESEREDIFQKVSSNDAAIVCRIGKNSGRFKTSNGHYIAIVDYKEENGKEMVFVLDSAQSVENRTGLEGTSSNRNGWVPLRDVVKALNSNENMVIISRKDGIENG